jgi:hypothetical protein
MTGSYYFWKWADNDLPGPPAEVHAALLRGEFHPGLQTFDARPLLKKLEGAAAQGRKRGEEWDWQVTPHHAPNQARFIFATCPVLDHPHEMRWRMIKRLFALDVSGCDAESGRLVDFFLPKLSSFESSQEPDEHVYDMDLDELPVLLRKLRVDSYAILVNRWNHFVQCVKVGHRFRVEWRENYELAALARFDQWAAEYTANSTVPKQFVPAGIGEIREHHTGLRRRETKANEEELLRYSDTLRIFKAFLRGEPRPTQYRWENINHIVS